MKMLVDSEKSIQKLYLEAKELWNIVESMIATKTDSYDWIIRREKLLLEIGADPGFPSYFSSLEMVCNFWLREAVFNMLTYVSLGGDADVKNKINLEFEKVEEILDWKEKKLKNDNRK